MRLNAPTPVAMRHGGEDLACRKEHPTVEWKVAGCFQSKLLTMSNIMQLHLEGDHR